MTGVRGKRVFVGLSGGVDSAVSAALLKQEGYDVVGAFITIMLEGYPCAAMEDRLWAQRAAAHLKIPFVEVDLSEAYKRKVFEVSMREWECGRTPNPDVLCNREIKFGLFFDWCMAQGADMVATGHYARLRKSNPSRHREFPAGNSLSLAPSRFDRGLTASQGSFASPTNLCAAVDKEKDQSYFLALVPQEKLAKTLFPVGGMRKGEVRALAGRLGLPNAARPDSQGLCFLGDISVGDILRRELPLVPGDVLSESGEVVGRHDGVQLYTLGQRHGFTLFAGGPHTPPHYVVAKDPEFNAITVSPRQIPLGSGATAVRLDAVNRIGEVADGACLARWRYRGELVEATLKGSEALLHEPRYVPEGQTLALYEGERCLGGGIIEQAKLADIASWLSSSESPTARRSRSKSTSSSSRSRARAPMARPPRR